LREIVLDTETTGLDPAEGHRIVEIGCVELFNHVPTGRVLHHYLNPDRDVPEGAAAVHGLTLSFLADKPRFGDIASELDAFIGEACIVAHNAGFDLAFLNAERARIGLAPVGADRICDTLLIARQKYPGAQNSLDALCRRFSIDLSERGKHGALLDCKLLASVYVELMGGHQARFELVRENVSTGASEGPRIPARQRPAPLGPRITDAELDAHMAFVATLGDKAIWLRYAPG
jgi:DNA polymerase-3 subunit epsilon